MYCESDQILRPLRLVVKVVKVKMVKIDFGNTNFLTIK